MTRTLVRKIIETIADSKGVEPAELDIKLAEHVDVDAVSRLADHENSSWTLVFELPDHDVTVTGDGTVLVEDRIEENWMST